jgi:DNA-binding response OmpR family regulator
LEVDTPMKKTAQSPANPLPVRRQRATVGETMLDERVRVNFGQHYAVVDNTPIALTPIETRLLHTLYQQRGRALSPGYLMVHTWAAAQPGTVGSLWVHLHRLRHKLEQNPSRPQYIVTQRGQGYCLPNRATTERY